MAQAASPYPTGFQSDHVEDYSTWPIVKAVQYGIFPRVVALVEPKSVGASYAAYDVDNLDDEGVSLLHWAAINNRLAIARYLLSKGALVDRIGGHLAATPLHWAIRQSHLNMVHLLLQHGADPTVRDNTGLACIHVAVQMGSVPVIIYLLARGVYVDSRDANGITPLMVACMHTRSSDVFRLLIAWGADLTLSDSRGNSAAHYAVNFSNVPAVLALNKAGADWNSLNAEGKAPYEVRNVPWLSDRVQSMARVQVHSSKLSTDRLSRLRCSEMPHSPKWRFRLTMAIPPTILLSCVIILSLDFGFTAGFISPSLTVRRWFGYSLKLLLLISLSFCCRRILWRISDYQSQIILLFSLAISTTALLTATYFLYLVPHSKQHWVLHFSFLICVTGLWVAFYRCVTTDPGYIPTSDNEDRQLTVIRLVESAISQVDDDDGQQSKPVSQPLERFCTTCLVQKPLRSKHCASCDRCVARFDHHCPWIYNCVGMNNHVYFMLYLVFTSFSCALFVLGSVYYWFEEPTCLGSLVSPVTAKFVLARWLDNFGVCLVCDPWVIFCTANAAFYSFWTFLLFCSQLYQMVWLNTTTNERINIDRYVEFTGGLSFSRNNKSNQTDVHSVKSTGVSPYDRGVWRNLLDLIGLPGYTGSVNTDWRRIYSLDQILDSQSVNSSETDKVNYINKYGETV
ncbi:hypothetical protein P879_02402 [Paragonimus westermani]|uniref:Palmitoyltransferase n=1 Tax=Paragonimus westermani TaxID=34504 RepID=A0A8T0DRI4_9TREM|nr:hypothetical protein P879_02402 [Paragonimus westermani]